MILKAECHWWKTFIKPWSDACHDGLFLSYSMWKSLFFLKLICEIFGKTLPILKGEISDTNFAIVNFSFKSTYREDFSWDCNRKEIEKDLGRRKVLIMFSKMGYPLWQSVHYVNIKCLLFYNECSKNMLGMSHCIHWLTNLPIYVTKIKSCFTLF